MPEIYQITVKLLDGKSKSLNFTAPSIPVESIKSRLKEITGIPVSHQRLITGTNNLTDSSTLNPLHGSHSYPTLHLLGRLLGGKGGFGSLLRGAATKAGQKKTNNFDACRDMSGRRLRHVNAEKKLEEWRAEEGERRLEKIAEDFLKKKAKEVAKKAGKAGEAEKYVAKYREDSAKCMEVVEKSVREAIGNLGSSKRKAAAAAGTGADSKRLKIWMGKRAVGDSDSEDEDDSDNDEEENGTSVVLNNENQSESHEEGDGSSGSVTGQKLDGESSAGIASESGVEEGSDTKGRSSGETSPSSDARASSCQIDAANEPAPETLEERIVENGGISVSEEAVASEVEACHADKEESNEPDNLKGTIDQNIATAENDGSLGGEATVSLVSLNSEVKQGQETVVESKDISDAGMPLNLDDFGSAAELEALGMDKLKSELQSRGLKCGGTLQERAARLFLLKTTPLDKLPKKLLAKK